ncbi:MAG TPA: ROK family protein [Patescibacteria group bacterium]|nr:ROK family protein [Patescibacteria group bacterium]
MATRHLGLDLGATNLKWAVLEQRDGAWSSVARAQVPTRHRVDPNEVPGAVVSQLIEVARGAERASGPVSTVGIGIPGLYDPATGSTRFLVNVPGPWAGHPVAGPVRDAIGVPVALINDARAFGLAELRLGAGRGAASMIGLTLGTGVGGVIAIDDRVVQGHDGTAGELGHQTIDPDGPPCGCGNHGCLEAFVRADRIAESCGTSTVEEAVERARAGDRRATEGIDRIGRYVGIGIANMITVITPDRVVVGGGIAAAADLLFPPIRDEIRRRVRTTSLDTVQLVSAELGTWAGAIGAAIHGTEPGSRHRPVAGPADISSAKAAAR